MSNITLNTHVTNEYIRTAVRQKYRCNICEEFLPDTWYEVDENAEYEDMKLICPKCHDSELHKELKFRSELCTDNEFKAFLLERIPGDEFNDLVNFMIGQSVCGVNVTHAPKRSINVLQILYEARNYIRHNLYHGHTARAKENLYHATMTLFMFCKDDCGALPPHTDAIDDLLDKWCTELISKDHKPRIREPIKTQTT